MNQNNITITEDHWRQFSAELRQDLRRVLKRKSAIVGRQVLEVASALCEHGRPDVALALYDTLAGEPGANHGCGLGATMDLRRYMGQEGDDWTYGSDEFPLLLPTRHLPGGVQEDAR